MAASGTIKASSRRTWMYIAGGVFVFSVMLIGFQIYYLNLIIEHRPRLQMKFANIHALMMTAWCITFLVQAYLIRIRKISYHRALGKIGILLFALIVVDAVPTSFSAVRLDSNHLFGPPAPFLAFLLGLLFEFAVLGGAGIMLRHRPEAHKRLMLASLLALLPAGLIRINFPPLFIAFPVVLILLTDVAVAVAGVYDYRRRGRVHPAFVWSLVFLIVLQGCTYLLAQSETWSGFVASHILS